MREILLRSYDDELESFYYFFNGKYYSDIDLTCELEPSFHDMYFNWNNAEYFTGLLDKNGNKIFENDKTNIGVVLFENGCFGIKYKFNDFIHFELINLDMLYLLN